MTFRFGWRVIAPVFAVIAVLGMSSDARAQSELTVLKPLNNTWRVPAIEPATATEYGKAVLAKMATSLAAHADQACLDSKKLKADAFGAPALKLMAAADKAWRAATEESVDRGELEAVFTEQIEKQDVETVVAFYNANAKAQGALEAVIATSVVDDAWTLVWRTMALAGIKPKGFSALDDGDEVTSKISADAADALVAATDSVMTDDQRAAHTKLEQAVLLALTVGIDSAKRYDAAQDALKPILLPILAEHCIVPTPGAQ
jgi:hypothetical protein